MKNKSNTYPTDDEAEAEAAEARRQGTQLIENHLSMHLSQNPDSSFVTWIATLHPENAEVSIDQRFFVPNNPWWTVYEGAKNDIPIATAVPVNDDLAAASEQPIPVSTYNPEKPASTSTSTKTEPKSPCSPIDSFIGFVLSLIAILTVFGLETSACIIYFVAAGIWKSAKAMGHTGLIPWILYHVLMIVYWILAIIDSCLLLGSVLAVELVAGVCYILSLLFAGCQRAAAWHQYIRRTCHTLRWAFRSQSSSPPRRFCACCKTEGQSNNNGETEGKTDPQAQIPTYPTSSTRTDTTSAFVAEEKGANIDEKSGIVDDYKTSYAN